MLYRTVIVSLATLILSFSGFEALSSQEIKPVVYKSDKSCKLVAFEDFSDGFDTLWDARYIVPASYKSGLPEKSLFLESLREADRKDVLEELFPKKERQRGRVLRYLIREGTNERSPVRLGIQSAAGMRKILGAKEFHEIYLEHLVYVPKDHDPADGSQKWIRFVRTGKKGKKQERLEFNLWITNDNTALQLACYHKSAGQEPHEKFKWGDDGLQFGRWIRVGLWVRLNSRKDGKDIADGFARLYLGDPSKPLDGKLKPAIAIDDVVFRPGDERGFTMLSFGGNYSNRGPSSKDSEIWFDDLQWWTTRPPAKIQAAACKRWKRINRR